MKNPDRQRPEGTWHVEEDPLRLSDVITLPNLKKQKTINRPVECRKNAKCCSLKPTMYAV